MFSFQVALTMLPLPSASNSYDAFNEYIVLNVEDVMVDLC